MSRKISIIIFYFITIQISVLGQNIDSLEQQLTKVQNIDKIDLLNQLSEEYCNEGYYQKAHDYADEALEIAQKYNNKTETANAYCQLGKSYNFLQIYDSSLIYFDLALELFENLDDQEGKANTLRNIGRLYENKYDYNKSLEYYIESLKMFEELNLLNELGGVYQDIGYVYICSEKYDLALKYYEKALAIYDELQDKYSISVTYNNIGIAYDAMKDVEKALEYYNKSIVLNKELGNEIVAAYIMHNIGIIYNNEGELDTAYKYFKESLNITESYEDPYGVCYNLTRIAEILRKQNKLDSALIILDKSLEYSILIDDKKSISENYLEYSNIFELKKDYFKAFEFYKKYDQLQDTIFNDDMIKQMNELETKYQSEKKDAENLLLKEQSRKREIFTYFLAVIILLVLFLAVVFFRGKRKQQKVNQLLEIKNNEINQQKEEIITQRDEIEIQKQEIEIKHNQIKGSINYAKRIQEAVLPRKDFIELVLPEHFIFFKPRDIVSGDFYFIKQIKNYTLIAAADCTGHGVPGAFMSMLGIALLNELVRNTEIQTPAQLLNELRNQIKSSLQQVGQVAEQQDGMDIAFCAINLETMEMSFSGAHNPCWIFRNEKQETKNEKLKVKNESEDELFTFHFSLFTLEADHQPVGIYLKEKPFTEQKFQLVKNDVIYIFSDGYISQFGGKKNLPLKSKYFKELLSEICFLELSEQKQILENKFNEWKGNNEQTDDVLVIGVKI